MAERGVLALCLQAPGETTAAVACAALASALSLPFSLPPPPSPHLRPHPRRSTREGDPPASSWRLVTTSRARDWMQEHYARAARQRTLFRAQQSAAASPNTE